MHRKAKLVIVDPSPAVTGALRCAARMARLLAPWADTMLVISSTADIPPAELEHFDSVERISLVHLRKSARSLLLYLPALLLAGWRLRKLLAKREADILVLNDFNLMQGAVARLFGYRGRIVTWVRFDPAWFPRILARAWLAAAYWSSDVIVAVSEFIERRVPPSPKVQTIYDSHDLELPVGRAPSAGRPTQDIIFLGNYTHSKGQHHAIEMFSMIADEFPESRLIFYGGDLGLEKNRAYRRALEERAAAVAEDRIIFRGFATDLVPVFAGAAAAANLSESESFSLSCLEAGQLGIPVVAFRSGGPEEIIEDGVTGFLCPLGDTAAAAQAMRRLLADPAEAARMGEAAARRVEQRFGPAAFTAAARSALGL